MILNFWTVLLPFILLQNTHRVQSITAEYISEETSTKLQNTESPITTTTVEETEEIFEPDEEDDTSFGIF